MSSIKLPRTNLDHHFTLLFDHPARQDGRASRTRQDHSHSLMIEIARKGGFGLAALAVLEILGGCVGGGTVAPPDMAESAFLSLYVGFAIACLGLALLLRLFLRPPAGKVRQDSLRPVEIAFLHGGGELAAASLLASLVQKGMIQGVPGSELYEATGMQFGELTVEENVVYQACIGQGLRAKRAQAYLYSELDALASDLRRRGLLLSHNVRQVNRLIGTLVALVPVGLGLAEIWTNLADDRPVMFPAGVTLMALAAMIGLVAINPKRTLKGDATLRQMKGGLSGPVSLVLGDPNQATEAMLSVALFGIRSLRGGPLDPLYQDLKPERLISWKILDDLWCSSLGRRH